MHIRKAASVLPEPVGAEIRVVFPEAMCGQPYCCGSVGVPNRDTNQSRTSGCAHCSSVERACEFSLLIVCADYNAKGILLAERHQRLGETTTRTISFHS